MKLRQAVLWQYDRFLKYALPLAVIYPICTYLGLKTEQQFGDACLTISVTRFSPLNVLIFLFVACGFREQNHMLAQFGFSREKSFLSFLCFLPASALLGLFQYGSAVLLTKDMVFSRYAFSYSFDSFNPLLAEERGAQLIISILFALFAALFGYFVGTILYYSKRSVRIALIPAALLGLYGLFILFMARAEGVTYGFSAYNTLFLGENTAFPLIHTLVINFVGVLLLLNGDWLLTRKLPVR